MSSLADPVSSFSSALPASRGPLAAWLLAWVAHVAAFLASSAIVPLSDALQVPDDRAAATLVALLVVAAIDAALVTLAVRRSAVRGWRLAGALTFTWFGLATFMTQIETAWFLDAFPLLSAVDLARLFAAGLVFSATWVPLAVWAAGGFAPTGEAPTGLASGLVWRVPALGVLYAALYFTFGYYVAWQWPEVRVFYAGDAAPTTFLGQLAIVARTDLWLFPFQVLRGGLWALFLVPTALVLRRRGEAALIVGLLCALAPTTQLLYPNVLMPEAVRMAHFLEVATSTGIFGIGATLLLRRR